VKDLLWALSLQKGFWGQDRGKRKRMGGILYRDLCAWKKKLLLVRVEGAVVMGGLFNELTLVNSA